MTDEKMLSRWLSLLTYPVELRIPNTRKKTISGYYDNAATLQRDIEALASSERTLGKFDAIYATINPVRENLLARAYNRFDCWAKSTTADADIVHRLWLPIDADSIRPAGISSTDAEHDAAMNLIAHVRQFLAGCGFPPGLLCDSGNGWHAPYRIDLPNTDSVRDTIQRFLELLADKFDNPQVKLDRTVFNAARVWKIYGTMARKGDEVGGRKHRLARIVEQPAELVPVDLTLIEAVISRLGGSTAKPIQAGPAKVATSSAGPVGPEEPAKQGDVRRSIEFAESFIKRHAIQIRRHGDYQGGKRWGLETCPLCGEADKSAVLMVKASGKLAYKCQHNRCFGKGWQEFKKHFQPMQSTGGKPWIIVGRQTADMVADAWAAIEQANNPPQWFIRGGALTRLRFRPVDLMPYFDPMGEGATLEMLSQVAIWKRPTKTKEGETIWHDAPIPGDVRKIVQVSADSRLPVVLSIVETPAFTDTGKLLLSPGYDPDSRTWYAPADGLQIPPVADKPSEADVQRAKDLILGDVLVDFPFTNEADRAHAVALLLLPFGRQQIDGPTPLYLIDAPTEGTGKGLLARCFALIATGRGEEAMPECRDEAEFSKSLTSALLDGPAYIMLDNISRPISSPTFAAILTARTHKARLLGGNQMAELPVNCVWLATGNNVHASKEITRRIVRIRLDAEMEQPQFRSLSEFKHADLEAWVRTHRPDLVWAALTLWQAWIAQGRPAGKQTLGSFSSWAATMGGILDVAGIAGFLGNLTEQYADVNSSDAQWREFVACWWATFGERPKLAGELVPLAIASDVISDPKNASIQLGHLLGKNYRKIYGRYRIERDGQDKDKRHLYCLRCVKPADDSKPAAQPSKPATLSTSEAAQDKPAVATGDGGHSLTLAERACALRLIGRNGWVAEPILGTNGKPAGGYRVGSFPARFDQYPDEAVINWRATVADRAAVTEWVRANIKQTAES